MVTPLEAWEIKALEGAQQLDIHFRRRFLHASVPTQKKIVSLLESMSKLIEKEDEFEAQKYFFTQMARHSKDDIPYYIDQNRVDWNEVRGQILHFCFSDHDMEGYRIVTRRIESELTEFRALRALPHEVHEEY